jgi:tetratricopeptide (TPR) repeat protein
VILKAAIVSILFSLGCGGLFADSPSGAGVASTTELSPAVRALRVRVLEDMGFVAEGDTDPSLNEKVKAAVQAELVAAGLTVLRGREGKTDADIRLEIRVTAAVYFLHGHLTLTAESDGIALAIVPTGDEFHRDKEFPSFMAKKAVFALLHSPGLTEFAEKKNPHASSARHETRSVPVRVAPVESKPRSEAAAKSKEHFTQGTRHYELGHYQEALTEYEAAYMEVPDPAFLFNIGQCHRKMGHDKEAISFYKSYLRNAPNAPNRADVQKRINEMEGGK